MPSPVRVQVAPAVISWAIKRSQREDYLRQKYSKLDQWENGELQPTMKQLASFAKDARVAQGYLYLSEPPDDRELEISDFRTVQNLSITRPSPDLIDTLDDCLIRQNWYREYLLKYDDDPHEFVGSAHLHQQPKDVARAINELIRFNTEVRAKASNWSEAFRLFIQQAEAIGVMVMTNGVVGNETRRNLNPDEFRGFSISDPLAPLVFVNGADAISARIFTLAHEIAHIWLGESALSDTNWNSTQQSETWCNQVAAELLAPIDELIQELQNEDPLDNIQKLSKHFKVSRVVILWRLVDAGKLNRHDFNPEEWIDNTYDARDVSSSTGGNFYRTLTRRVGRRFGMALVASTLEGETLYKDAFRMLGIGKTATFQKFAEHIGYPV